MFETILTYEGRITRLEYFILFIILTIISFFCAFLPEPFYLISLSVIIVFSLFIEIKRCHDINKSGWYILLFLIPFVNIYWFFCLLLNDGTYGPNKYGEDPKVRVANDKKSKRGQEAEPQ